MVRLEYVSRFQVVSGKGGTGKTTVAAALALALATEGKRTLLVEVEGRQGIAQLFETESLPYEERKIAVAPGGGEVFALAIDPELALLDYLQMFYKLGGAGRALKKLGAIDFATTIAPGLRDVLLTGKACEAVRRKDKSGRFVYDHVVMDAPPTGRVTRFLNVNDEVAGLAKIGPIHHQAQAVMRVLKSPQTAVHLVTLLEEMPVQETADGIAELRARGCRWAGSSSTWYAPSSSTTTPSRWCAERAVSRGRGRQVARRRRTRRRAQGRQRRAARRPAARAGRRVRRAACPGARPAGRPGRSGAAAGGTAPAGRGNGPRGPVPPRRGPEEAGHGPEEAGRRMTPSADQTAGSGPAEDAGSEDGLRARRTLAVDPLLDDPRTRIVVCCGAGGVGKTTTAAALGLRAAERGRKVVVLTIDPARRLAQSMGIDSLDNTPRRVKGIDNGAGGELHAMMLDMKRTFDEIVEAHADPERAAAILGNPFYQSLSAGFAGTQEYMAMEKLGQLRARDEWDLIVVDTPPSRSALDFLDAPKRLGSFLDGKLIRVLMAPAKVGGRAGMKFLNVGMSMMTGALGKLLGGQLLRDVQTFVAAMDTMFGGFRTRADATYRLLQAPGTAFLVVAAPERDALREAAYFVERLAAEDMPLAGLVLNRVHVSGAAHLPAERALAAAESLGEHLTGTGTDGHHTGPSADDHLDGTGADDHRRGPGADDHHARAAEPSATRAGAAPADIRIRMVRLRNISIRKILPTAALSIRRPGKLDFGAPPLLPDHPRPPSTTTGPVRTPRAPRRHPRTT